MADQPEEKQHFIEFFAYETIGSVPTAWADDDSYVAWHDPELRAAVGWVMVGGALQMVWPEEPQEKTDGQH